jgi:AcrR family transcriptional regulator
MARPRPANRLDEIANAATSVFIRHGFGPARVADIAREAGVGPGTVYLYAEGKDALFDLALRRAFEDPTLLNPTLPHPAATRSATADHLWRCLQNAAHFPMLWLGAESPRPAEPRAEIHGIIAELYAWLRRYATGIQLAERCAPDWPEIERLFHRRFWRGGVRRVGDYLARRSREGVLVLRYDPHAAAHLVVEALAWMAVRRHWAPDSPAFSDAAAAGAAVELITDGLTVRL